MRIVLGTNMETIELNCDRCHKPFPRKASKNEGDLKRDVCNSFLQESWIVVETRFLRTRMMPRFSLITLEEIRKISIYPAGESGSRSV